MEHESNEERLDEERREAMSMLRRGRETSYTKTRSFRSPPGCRHLSPYPFVLCPAPGIVCVQTKSIRDRDLSRPKHRRWSRLSPEDRGDDKVQRARHPWRSTHERGDAQTWPGPAGVMGYAAARQDMS